jgi:hypothetical protein
MAPANTTVHAPTWTLPEMIAVGAHDGSWINDGLLPSVSNPHLFPRPLHAVVGRFTPDLHAHATH